MRVGVNARTFSTDEPGGAVQTARRVTEGLAVRDDVDVRLYGSISLRDDLKNIKRVSSFAFPDSSQVLGTLWERTVLPALVRRDDLDVLLCPNANAPIVPVDCPVVTYVHDVNAQRDMSSGLHGLYRRLLVPPGVRHSDAVVTVSEFSAGEIVDHLPVSEDDVHVIYNGVDKLYLNAGGAEPCNIPEKYLLYVGAMNPRKNVSGIVETFKILKRKYDVPHDLVLVGPGNKGIFEDLQVDHPGDGVVTPGFVPATQLKYYYEQADAFLYPSYYEGFGLPPLEAMACGTPVVASNRASLPEVLGDAALLVDPDDPEAIADAIYEVLSRPERREDLIDRGYDQAKRYNWDTVVEEMLAVCRSIGG